MAWVTIRQMHERVADVMSEIGIKKACQRAARRAGATGGENRLSRLEGRLWYVNDESEQAAAWLAREAAWQERERRAALGADAARSLEDADRRIEAADRERDELAARVADLEARLERAQERWREERRRAQERAEGQTRTILELQAMVVDWQRRAIDAQDELAALKTAYAQDGAAEHPTAEEREAAEAARAALAEWRADPTPMPAPDDHESVARDAQRYQALAQAAGEPVTNTGLAGLWVSSRGGHPSDVTVGRRLRDAGVRITSRPARR